MIQCILTCLALIILLIFVNLGISHLCGTDTSGQFKTALEGALTIFLLYLLLLTLLNHTSFAQGIPFAGKIEVYGSLTQLFHADFLVFVLECTKLISLTFLIAILSGIFTNFLPGASFGIKFIKNIGLRLGWCADSQLFFTCYGKDSRISVGRYSPAVLPVRHSPSHDAGYAAGEFVGTESQQ